MLEEIRLKIKIWKKPDQISKIHEKLTVFAGKKAKIMEEIRPKNFWFWKKFDFKRRIFTPDSVFQSLEFQNSETQNSEFQTSEIQNSRVQYEFQNS